MKITSSFKVCKTGRGSHLRIYLIIGKKIAYGSVICDAYHNTFFKDADITKEKFQQNLEKMISCIEGNNDYEDEALNLSPMITKQQQMRVSGFVLNDKTDGCFPLIFYYHSRHNNSSRVNVLQQVLIPIIILNYTYSKYF